MENEVRYPMTTITNTSYNSRSPFRLRFRYTIEIGKILIVRQRFGISSEEEKRTYPNKNDDDDDGIWYVSFHLVRLFSLHIGQFVLDFTFSKLEWEQWDRMRATSHNWHARFVYFGIDILINKCPFWTNWMEIIVHLNGTHSRSNAQSFPFNSKSTLV